MWYKYISGEEIPIKENRLTLVMNQLLVHC